jgi:alanyl-tRNA synthetase
MANPQYESTEKSKCAQLAQAANCDNSSLTQARFSRRELSSIDIRKCFLDFYKRQSFVEVDGSSVIPRKDPTLLLINSGMAPMKSYFLGLEAPPHSRVCNIQTCVRTNDIEEIGDSYHLTMFEMMGNWTFGDLDKKDAIHTAHELVTEVFGIETEKLVVTYYGGDSRYPSIPPDRESCLVWRGLGFDECKVIPLGSEDNLWGPPGDSGPCGPCTEMFIDRGDQYSLKEGEGPDSKSGRFIEIWNPGVFMEYFMDENKVVTPLAARNLDAGAGVERWAMILQRKDSIYEIDSIAPILDVFLQASPEFTPASRAARIMTDHVRTATVLIAEGISPSNHKEGYVLRRLIRRAALQAALHNIPVTTLNRAAEETLRQFNHKYPESDKVRREVSQVLMNEVSSFLKALSGAQRELEKLIARTGGVTGEDAFKLKESRGMPLEITQELASSRGIVIDIEGYNQAAARHQELSRRKNPTA